LQESSDFTISLNASSDPGSFLYFVLAPDPQYGLATGNSLAGYSVMILAPSGVSTTSSSMRAAE
jgi:hypothetical protein